MFKIFSLEVYIYVDWILFSLSVMMMDLFFTTIDLNNIAVMTKEFIKNAVSPSLAVFGIIGKYEGANQ